MKPCWAAVAFIAMADIAAAQTVPVPRPRPVLPSDQAGSSETSATPKPSACRSRLAGARVMARPVENIDGPQGCGGDDLVRLEAVTLLSSERVNITPPAVLRCETAEVVADWIREDLAGLAALHFGSGLRSVRNYSAYHCRSRNNLLGGVMSEHGTGNAMDVGSITFVNGQTRDPTDLNVSRDFREGWKKSVCGRFTTVLGPGSDGYHENHVHVDLKERHNGYRICQWDIRTHDEKPIHAITNNIPLPQPRPKVDAPASKRR